MMTHSAQGPAALLPMVTALTCNARAEKARAFRYSVQKSLSHRHRASGFSMVSLPLE